LALVGPTAVGKSQVALHLAEKLAGDIISVDSMQVYRGLDIGTAKPSRQDRARVRHHLIDVVDITTPFDAAQFLRLANQAVADVRAHGRVPILCGGTGLYFKAFYSGLGEAPAGSAGLRAEIEATPLPELLRELEQRDPVAYGKMDRRNARRVVRALEVIRLTGKPFSVQRADWSGSPASELRGATILGLVRETADLHQRIEARVETMFEQGLVAETEALLTAGLESNRTALQALGYRQAAEYLRGVRPLPETIALVKTRTRQFAKRQLTWFRRQLPVQWIESAPDQPAELIAADLAGRYSHSELGAREPRKI
jgi:tRNA dimethylallyltransferase